ncbi:hypothetical protein [Halomarina rubra]|uniref:Ribbon-helix-helix protein CopG domain-containing protein n=1 Tax=Halomarina rubra TaxID=2071873 RepID=A0ABD6AS20_9EURY|nr:hypothetical protein [Halomarina rubra]
MANTSIVIPDELLDKFEDKMIQMKARGELDRDITRSEMIRRLMRDWAEEPIDSADEGNPSPAVQAAD